MVTAHAKPIPAQLVPAQPGVVACWRKPPTGDDPSPYYTRPVVAWALTDSCDVIGLVPSGSPWLVPVTDRYAYPQGDPVGDFADYRFPDDRA
jgi:hypothetical protein